MTDSGTLMDVTTRTPREYSDLTGHDLRVRRVQADVRSGDVAAHMGVAVSTVSRIEGARRVTAQAAGRYLEALAALATVTTDNAA